MENRILSQRITDDIDNEPVTLTEFKKYAAITYDDYDSLLANALTVARRMITKACSKVFGEATVSCSFVHSGCSPISLPFGYFGSLESIEFRYRELTDWQTLSLDDTSFEIEDGKFYGECGHYKITYKTESIAVEEDVKNAIKAQAMFLWENRGDERKSGDVCPEARAIVMQLTDGGLAL